MTNNAIVFISIAANVVTVLLAIGGVYAALFKRGVNEGRTIEILSILQTQGTDHEARIRVLEAHRTGGTPLCKQEFFSDQLSGSA